MDTINLAKACRLMDGDKSLFNDLFQVIERSLEERYERLEAALASESAEDLEMYAHQLKGALRNVAADAACELLFQLEKCGLGNDFALAKQVYPQVRPAVNDLLTAFRSRTWEVAFAEYTKAGGTT
ncbi:MAG: Hpt domain-containing protein [Spirochaetales bacterium]